MSKKILISVLVLLSVAVMTIVLISQNSTPRMVPDIRIGIVLPLTGKAATYGERSLQGIQLAVDVSNGTSNTHEDLRIIVEDSQSQASRAVTSFIKLVDLNKVPVVVGLLTSDEALACAPLAMRYKVVLFTPGATSKELKEAGSYIFRNRESVELQTAVIAEACANNTGKGGIVIMHANASNAISYRDTFKDACETLGATVLGTIPFNEGKTDYRSELEQLRTLTPEAVYLAGYDSELGLILKQAHEIGLKTQFYASAGAVTPKLLEVAGIGAEGLIAASASFDPLSTAPHVQEFVKAYKARYNKEPDWLAANSYDAILMLAQIAKAGQFNAETIRNGLSGMKDFPGVSGTTTFDEFGGVKKPISLVRVSKGEFLPLRTEQMTTSER